MRKMFLLGTALIIFSASFAITTVETPIIKADQLYFPVGNTGQKISYAQLATISLADMQALTGRKMSGMERMNFRLAQKKMRKSIADDGTIKNKKIAKFLTKKGNAGESGFHIGGFALGFFLGLIGVVIAYVINDDYKRNRVKWAWIGWGIFVVLYIALLIAFWDSLYY